MVKIWRKNGFTNFFLGMGDLSKESTKEEGNTKMEGAAIGRPLHFLYLKWNP